MKKFKDDLTRSIFDGEIDCGLTTGLIKKAQVKMVNVLIAKDLKVLITPPSNHLEKLKGNREGQYSIRVNNKYRICFDWINNEAFNIEFIDYHK
jgi:proteic killer suppression protein